MKKIVTVVAVVMGLVLAGTTKAQAKIGTISLAELIPTMPEYKRADTSMNEFNNALQQQYQDMVNEYQQQQTLLRAIPLNIHRRCWHQRKDLSDLLGKLQNWQTTAQQMSQAEQEPLTPIQKKALMRSRR